MLNFIGLLFAQANDEIAIQMLDFYYLFIRFCLDQSNDYHCVLDILWLKNIIIMIIIN